MDEVNNLRLGKCIFELANGNKQALAEIYLLTKNVLYAVGNIYFDQIADIEDEIQNLLISLFYKSKKFKHNKNACAWLVTLYRNSIKNHLRRKKREEFFIREKVLDTAKILEYNKSEQYLENHLFVAEVMDNLTEYEKLLLIYRYWCNSSISEVAALLGKPKSTIESQLIKLKEKIEKM